MRDSTVQINHYQCWECHKELPTSGDVYYRPPKWARDLPARLVCAECRTADGMPWDVDRRPCKGCERVICFAGGGQRSANFCSPLCRKRYTARGGHLGPMACKHCGETFQPTRDDAKYCSGRCRVAAHRAKSKE